jgi:Circadian oscillating protein COP23
MKIHLFSKITMVIAVIFFPTFTNSEFSYAAPITFFCTTYNGVPFTMARSPQRLLPIINWSSKYFSQMGFTPERRCMEVTRRLQTYYNQGRLNYITVGRLNRQSVACVTQQIGSPCSGLLFTLKPDINPNHLLRQIFESIEGYSTLLHERENRVYFDINQYLNRNLVNQTSRGGGGGRAGYSNRHPGRLAPSGFNRSR